ncbi:hypothetical protein [Clostridium tunisiense]|uniref:hypothetical protein n=1 Tax=Clostridium tunisiense TaxID=219748 RepID=UPI0002FC0B18|nr:hypothetical protein [Clostridium tunisiense]
MENKIIKLTDRNQKISFLSEDDIKVIKGIFARPIADAIQEIKNKNKEVEPVLRAVIPEAFIEAIKNGELKLMESKKGEILPSIVDSKNKVVKQVRLEEVKEQLDDKKKLDKLGEYALEQKLDAIKEQLECIICIVEDVEKGQRNDRYGKIDGAIKNINQSFLEGNIERRDRLQDMAQNNLNEAIEAINKEVNDSLSFFKGWEERSFIERNIGSFKYSTWNINRKFNKLCEDYLYISKAKNSLMELKLNQGMEKYKVDLMIEDLNEVDIKLKGAKVSNWLPPRSDNNEWKHRLLCEPKYKNELIIEYNTADVLMEESYNG